jgi:pimeloyl-ACP methyl ester carboxylesterase
MIDARHHFPAPDGTLLAYHELGDSSARPLVLIHGLFSSAHVNWIKYGHAALLAQAGFRVIMPDLRAHGASAKPHDAAAYPKDALADDGLALIRHLGLTDYDLGGFSLGARTTVRMLARGATPRRAIIAGMGLTGLTTTGTRIDHFKHVLDNLGSFQRGSEEWLAEAFLKTTKGDTQALRLLLNSFTDTPLEAIRAITTPCAVICGDQDNDNGSADALAVALPNATRTTIPGTHMGCVVKPDLGEAIRDFLMRT